MKRETLGIRFSLAIAALLGPVAYTTTASAQADVEKPLTNVLLLVDTSGSMEYKAEPNPQTGQFDFPICHPGDPASVNEKSRWIDLLTVMTGEFENYSCFPQDRSSASFRTEFTLPPNVDPYDYGYVNPYNRVISNNCVVGPGVVPNVNNPYEFPDRAINYFPFTPGVPGTVTRPADLTAGAYPNCPGFSQKQDGVLDIFKGRLRFGLMTFDSHPDAGTGLTGAATADYQTGVDGNWSYFLNGIPRSGRPPNCENDLPQEVGARNAAAPPWEGRMVAFGASNAPPTDADLRDEWIQKILLAERPYGATPIAGLMDDARAFLWNDTTTDPLTPGADFGPYNDPLWKKDNCRKTVIILLSDGEPNLDLRPYCEQPGEVPGINDGKCPYDLPENIAGSLLNDPPTPNQSVETFVIGFALKAVKPIGVANNISCDQLTDDQCLQNPNDRGIQGCCTLNKIAIEGSTTGTRKAYFPKNFQELRSVFNEILGTHGTPTTRSAPAISTAVGAGTLRSVQMNASFAPSAGAIWAGKLTRLRTECDMANQPAQIAITPAQGDDFAANVNSGAGPARRFLTVLADDVGGTIPSSSSLRPNNAANTDGITNLAATLTAPLVATNFTSTVPPAAMNIAATDCNNTATAADCRDVVLGWAVGLLNSENRTRCDAPGSANCSLLGGIYNSSPKIVSGAPPDLLRTDPYRVFSDQMAINKRSTVLYTSTVDGFLHAFKVAPYDDTGTKVDQLENNELWAFVPPAVLPFMLTQYPDTPAVLLDGEPIVQDVVAEEVNNKFQLIRTAAAAQANLGTFRSALVQGFGEGQVNGGYFALDVTTPDIDAGGQGGPQFLWQLTRDDNGHVLFGQGGTPAITTVALMVNGAIADVPVAILPGGNAGTPGALATDAGPLLDVVGTDYDQRPLVSSYTGAEEARSLTIVRLDTGEIVRSFRTTDSAALIASGVVTTVTIPSPIVGRPVAYPADPGAVADRIFVGDRDGRLWRVNVSNSDPAQWTMDVFFDAFFGMNADQGQAIQTEPVVSVDTAGNITVNISTGEQRVQAVPAGTLNRVVSLTEQLNAAGTDFQAKVNWVTNLGCPAGGGQGCFEGERVTGPMSLFNGVLYFATGIPGTEADQTCAVQHYRLWGMDYLNPLVPTDLLQGGDKKLASGVTSGTPLPAVLVQVDPALNPPQGIVFGGTVDRQPSCFTTETLPSDYVGSGTHTQIKSMNSGAFQLKYQIGGVDIPTTDLNVPTAAVGLQPPKQSVQINSWAPIFE